MEDRVKRLTEVWTGYNDAGMIRQQVDDSLQDGDDSSCSREAGWSECKLIAEDHSVTAEV